MSDSPEWVVMRRKDRAVTDESWIEAMLTHAPFGVLALANQDRPFVNMNIFAFEPAARRIYFHTAKEGQTRSMVASNAEACFCISEMGRLLPAKFARNFSTEYSGVVVFGRVEIVDDIDDARRGLELIMAKYAPHLEPGVHYRPITTEEIADTTVYRLSIERWSGKRKVAPPDHPGAFRYGESAAPPWSDWQKVEQ